MIVIGVDVHKHSLTAVAVDELGRGLVECSGLVDGRVIEWARSLGEERLWAVEDCRHVTRRLEQKAASGG
jgi:transposase